MNDRLTAILSILKKTEMSGTVLLLSGLTEKEKVVLEPYCSDNHITIEDLVTCAFMHGVALNAEELENLPLWTCEYDDEPDDDFELDLEDAFGEIEVLDETDL